jgi:two-component system, NarL family, nitrate/nitrite response regulator NarL
VYTVVVCDAEPVAIEGVRTVLQSSGAWSLTAAETSLDRALPVVQEREPSLLLVDKAFGIYAVMNCLKVLRQQHSPTATVVWGVSLPEAEALRFLQAGAHGVIRKTAPVETLLECLRAVCAGETWVEPGVLLSRNRPARLARSSLTSRELQVMELVERGMKNKDIGDMLGIRTGTVKIHLRHIFEKTGIRGRYGLALSGLQAKGLLATPMLDAR